MSAAETRRRNIARWRKLTMTDEQLAEIGRRADQKLIDDYCSDCGVEIPNQQCGGLCERCLSAGPVL